MTSPLDAIGLFDIIEQLMAVPDNRSRAAILLRLPDAILPLYGGEIVTACLTKGFPQADGFIAARVTALTANRDAHGLLPYAVAIAVEEWRVAFSDMVAGK